MEERFEHLRCPMCGGELIYSEGTHDLCCVRNPYESVAALTGREGGALHEERAEYGSGESAYIYKVSGEEERGRLKRVNMPRPELFTSGYQNTSPSPLPLPSPLKGEGIPTASPAGVFAGSTDDTNARASHEKSLPSGQGAGGDPGFEKLQAGKESADVSDAKVKRHSCVFAVSYTESARFGTLWSIRIVHKETNYFALMRLMQKIEKRRISGAPLAANAPFQLEKAGEVTGREARIQVRDRRRGRVLD